MKYEEEKNGEKGKGINAREGQREIRRANMSRIFGVYMNGLINFLRLNEYSNIRKPNRIQIIPG